MLIISNIDDQDDDDIGDNETDAKMRVMQKWTFATSTLVVETVANFVGGTAGLRKIHLHVNITCKHKY